MQDEEWWHKIADKPHMVWCLKVASLGVDELARTGMIPWMNLSERRRSSPKKFSFACA
jgi:hypothetical protein